ncbi:MAG: hypothetical protein HN742_15320 [Lentisphaerae bacterium]|jgi:alpha-L-fucosidase|nr:hypothetical protein [Lentisphaerota bacterium]MBT4817585.1 hypothetical protein [Lentisphaerota bacterium]MBT5608530.1 hypothetical protein [Lentisphaerota bacterium]MBT7060243.1 hypothetical protein [Lentisphaerota bacterium]MBT7843247.1 hypothetical protein [Lentisphaerota bacterium]
MDTLDIGSMIQPFSDEQIHRDEGYYCWGPNLLKAEDGRYYMAYSRWPKATGVGGWLTDSEIALAVADQPVGPYTHLSVLLQGRGPGHWDELMAHNPKLKCFDGRYYLYYISSRPGPTKGHIRDSQRTGVAVSDSLTGPYTRFDEPIVVPAPPIYNVAVNPGVTRMADGRYLLIIKGDVTPKEPTEPFPQRLQALGIGESPMGPFTFLPDPAIADIDTEDASIWYDAWRNVYYAVFHAHKYIGLIASDDGIAWRRAQHYTITEKRLLKTDGSSLEPQRLERPSVFVEDGEPKVLCLGGSREDDWYCVLLPLG